MNDYLREWENKPEEIKRLCDSGIVPLAKDMEEGKEIDPPFLMGQVAGIISEVKSAREIVEDMVREAVDQLQQANSYLGSSIRL